MEPVLDETSLVPCTELDATERLRRLAEALQQMDRLGYPLVLRRSQYAADAVIGGGRTLRQWLSPTGNRQGVASLLLHRLAKAPYIDGEDGLMRQQEGDSVMETRVAGEPVIGLGYAAVTRSVAFCLGSGQESRGEKISVQIKSLEESGEETEELRVVQTYVDKSEVCGHEEDLLKSLYASVGSGRELVDRRADLWNLLEFGDDAVRSIATLTGNERVFRQLMRHLRSLQVAASVWQPGCPFEPSVTSSRESPSTLQHRVHGPKRDFATPQGYRHERWSWHTKLTGGNGTRLYYRPVFPCDGGVVKVLIGYFGDHLSTVNHP